MYQLKFCVWEVTRACTMRCLHCGTQAGNRRERELNELEALGIAGQLIDLGCKRVTLIGGEVTLCPYWSRLARFFVENGVICDIVTNGYRKTEQDFKEIQNSHIASAAVSVDGMEKLHNTIRGRGDAFYETDHFCRKMAETGIPLTAVTTITHDCLRDLKALFDWMGTRGICAWQWQQVSPMGNAREQAALSLRWEDVAEVFNLYAKLSKRQGGPRIVLGDNLGYYVKRDNRLLHRFHGCAAGLSVIGLDSEGNVRGCESLYDDRFIEGNLREITLREIWESPEHFAYNRKFIPNLLTGNCLLCDKGDVCAGGCRSFNAFHGALYEHPNCMREG